MTAPPPRGIDEALIRLADRLLDRRGNGAATIALWGSASATVAGVAALVGVGFAQTPEIQANAGAPPALMIDLSIDVDQAARTDMTEIGNAMFAAQEVQSNSIEPVEKPSETPDPLPDEAEKPVEEKPDEQPDEIKPPLPQMETVEVPLPIETPKPEPVKKPNKPAPASVAAIESAAEVQKSDRSAARQSGAGQSSAVAIATWESRLMTHLGRNKRYPADARSRGETGTAVVTFSLDRSGKVLSASLRKPSGHRDLDAEALDLVRRASPLPAPPPGAPLTITAPVRFSIK
ncbi:energy transducer TonB [Rhodomicrobium udaipurense JA643]|uniref:Energy transducer TonB n=1 Tax=Rhodomicrobium udaipurense TaxID=1202716 RepID=A0A8I1KIU6_9HYPH|nr:energy transducer TonB [Rhodomicrobium udaipurense]KAI95565.1 energy transducer TonB [Rhodomicrobium udaipurense JA643]MBJ7542126.1 energy transducer TonB [Rhodomicrobium udaipurense]